MQATPPKGEPLKPGPPKSDAARVADGSLIAPARTSHRQANGGFPEPPIGEPFRLVGALHHACGWETRVRLPASLPAHSVRRVICGRCQIEFDADPVELPLGAAEPQADPQAPASPTAAPASAKQGGDWLRSNALGLGAVVLVAVGVLGGLVLFGGGDSGPRQPAATTPKQSSAQFVKRSTYSLALPTGWNEVPAKGGAVFHAVAPDGGADAVLWIRRDPRLSFAAFENQSLAHLRKLAANARVFQRLPAPSGEGTVVQLRGEVPSASGQVPYLVTLREAGPYRYYLATSVQPNASQTSRQGAALIHGSFSPQSGP